MLVASVTETKLHPDSNALSPNLERSPILSKGKRLFAPRNNAPAMGAGKVIKPNSFLKESVCCSEEAFASDLNRANADEGHTKDSEGQDNLKQLSLVPPQADSD
ncbi:unnamed protein product, partial [marine sediment metagenome]